MMRRTDLASLKSQAPFTSPAIRTNHHPCLPASRLVFELLSADAPITTSTQIVQLHQPPRACRLVAEFLECSPASLVADAVESLCGEPLLHMVHTKEGARAACMALAYATAKERKKAVRAFKVGTSGG